MKRISFIIFSGFIIIFLFSYILPNYFFPSDILNYLPTFSIDKWEKPKNSLLADPVFQFEPWRHYTKERLLKGEFPLWNDRNGDGTPFFANPQTAVLWPFNFLYYIFPTKNALYLIPLLKLYFFGIFSYLYLHSLKCSEKISVMGSVGAVFSGFPLVWLLWPHTNVFIFLPLTLFLIEKIYSDNRQTSYRWYLLLSFVYLLAILGGHPETLFYIICVNLFYSLTRFWNQKKKIILTIFSICLGFLFGAIQILPFLEYLKNSFVLDNRIVDGARQFFLPLVSFTLNIIPFLLGAPHKEFYKPFSPYTNFQETIGGYTSPIILIMAITGFILYRKEIILKVWFSIVLFSWFLSYGLLPVSLISKLPLINISANYRLIGFAGFGLVIIAALTIDKIFSKKIFWNNNLNKLTSFLIMLSIILGSCSILFTNIFKAGKSIRIQEFLSFLQFHIAYILITTILFFLTLFFIYKKRLFNSIYIFILIIPILLQTFILFWNYNPTTSKTDYYPENEIIKVLKNLPKGQILEIGNLLLPSNINLMYGLSNIENNDAIEIKNYRKAFDNYFPVKNQWQAVDKVEFESLKKFGIRYILSDYDINLNRDEVQKKYNKILPPITSKKPIEINFEATDSDIQQIRLLTANFNRKNTCKLTFKIIEISTMENLSSSVIDCKNIRDFMYYSVDISTNVVKGNKYLIMISSNTSDQNNNIAFWGNKERQPFLQVYYKVKNSEDKYRLIWSKNSIYIWGVSGFRYFIIDGSYLLLYEKPEYVALETRMERDGLLETHKIYYPGWIAKIDGKNNKINKSTPFISLNIPNGTHFVEFIYRPLSFYLGLTITIISLLISFLFYIRQEIRQSNWDRLNNNLTILFLKVKKNIKWWEHILIYMISFTISSSLFIFLIKLISFKFKVPFTTAINWNTVHNYPKQQDYFYFFSGFIFITLFSICIWVFYVWIKLRKKV